MLTDLKVEGTEYTVKDIDPRNQYSYFVKAYRDDIVSSASSLIWVDGIAGLQVQTDEASDISPTSFTASWQPLGHASNYSVNVFKVLQPTVDLNNVTIIEESFDNINEGSVDNPGTDWQSPFDFGAKGWAATSWCATQPAWAKGMAGTTGTNVWMGIAGLVYTPVLDLSCYDGKGITVDATFVTTVDSFEYDGTTESEGVFRLNNGQLRPQHTHSLRSSRYADYRFQQRQNHNKQRSRRCRSLQCCHSVHEQKRSDFLCGLCKNQHERTCGCNPLHSFAFDPNRKHFIQV